MTFMSEKTKQADLFQREWHSGQVDKAGMPYAEHPARVAKLVQTHPSFSALIPELQESVVCAAYFHDVIEDCGVKREDLAAKGFSAETIDAVSLLTKEESIPKDEFDIVSYYKALGATPLARMVKMADMADNSNHARQALLSEIKAAKNETVDTEKYSELLPLLEPSDEEIQWWSSARKL